MRLQRYDIRQDGGTMAVDTGPWADADEAESRIAELEAALADCQSRLAGVRDVIEIYDNDRAFGEKWRDEPEYFNTTYTDRIKKIISPSFTCPGCQEKDGRLERAREAWRVAIPDPHFDNLMDAALAENEKAQP